MANQIVISSGAKVRNLNGVLTGTTGVVNSLGINVANGIPQLDGSGKILVSQLPNSVMEYKGTWNAATNTPTLANGTGNQGDVYLCSTAGTVNFGAGAITFAVGDQVIYSGTIWQKAGGSTGTVTSVAVTESGDALTITGSPITTSGTINIGFAGTTGQYINGAGGLTTFPSLTGYVPYTGATTNVALGEYGLSGGYIGLDTTPTSTPTSIGTLSWDSAYLTPKVVTGTGNTTLQIGQEEVILIHNNTGSTLTDGQVVYVTGSTGELPSVSLADASSETTSAATLGVITETIANGANGFATVSGIVHGLNTLAFNEGDMLWLSETAGQFTNVKPVSPAHLVLIGYVIKKAGGNGSILVKIQNTQELEECSDVLFTSLANNDILAYESSTDLWKNKTIANVLGYTPQAQLTLTTTGTSGAATLVGATLNIPNYSTDLSNYVTLDGIQSITGQKIFANNTLTLAATGSGGLITYLSNISGTGLTSTGANALGFNINNDLYFAGSGKVGGVFSFNNTAVRTYTLQNANGTLAFTSDIPSLSGYIQGSGTTNYVPKFTGSGTIGNSTIIDNTSYVKISTDLEVYAPSGSGALMRIASNGFDEVSFRAVNSSGGNKELLYFGSTIAFYTGALDVNSGTQRMTITPTGNVGIGANSPSFPAGVGLAISSATRSNLSLTDGTNALNIFQDGTSAYFNMYSSGDIIFRTTTGNTERLRITSAGNVGIGTTSPASKLTITGSDSGTAPTYLALNNLAGGVGVGGGLQIQSNGTSVASLDWGYDGSVFNSNLSAFGNLVFRTNGTTERMRITSGGNVGIGTSSPISISGYGIVSLNGTTGSVFNGMSNGVSASYFGTDTASTFVYELRNAFLGFGTNGTERMRITGGGNVLIGATSAVASSLLGVVGNTSSYNLLVLKDTGASYADNWYLYCINPSDVRAGGIQHTGSTTVSFVTTSDYRLKENAQPIQNALNKVISLNPVTYNWKEDGSLGEGFIAHELQEHIPMAVSGIKDAIDKDGKINPQGIDLSKIVPYLVKAIQEQQAQIEELKAKIK